MNLDILHARLIKAARLEVPSDQVSYAFEKRVMSRLGERRVDLWGYWAQSLWRAVVPCVAIALLFGAWTALDATGFPPATEEFAQHFENTVLADAVSPDPVPDQL